MAKNMDLFEPSENIAEKWGLNTQLDSNITHKVTFGESLYIELKRFIADRAQAKDNTLTGANGKQKARDFAEVTTPIWLIDRQLDLLPPAKIQDLSSNVLDPCTGDGRYLMCYLARRALVIDDADKLYQAISTLHGMDLQRLNVRLARQNLLSLATLIADLVGFTINIKTIKVKLKNNIRQNDFLNQLEYV